MLAARLASGAKARPSRDDTIEQNMDRATATAAGPDSDTWNPHLSSRR